MRFFPFEFFRSRFRRMSLRKIGDVNEEPLYILPSNGERTDGALFEFQGEVAESTSIENILKRSFWKGYHVIISVVSLINDSDT